MSMERVFAIYLEESSELLGDMERLLLELESDPSDAETRNALFRCVHTVKGSAGMFGLDHVVDFTHVVENVLDRLRDEDIPFSANLAQLLLRCRDHAVTLVSYHEPPDDADLAAEGEVLCAELAAYQADAPHAAAADPEPPVTEPESGARTWDVGVRFDADLLRHGMDPLSLIRYMGSLGEIRAVTPVTETLPAFAEMDPEACYFGFDIEFHGDVTRDDLVEVFDLIDDRCTLEITPREKIAQPEPKPAAEIPSADGGPDAASGPVLVHDADAAPVPERREGDRRQTERRAAGSGGQVRVAADKLDELINLVGELVIASAAVGVNAARTGDTGTREAAAAVSSLVEDIRDSSLQLRMVPIGDTFSRFQRVVRDVSAQLGKDIRLEITGADTELDKTVVEQVADPLTHLVRNACDHGLETAEARAEAGKPAQGTLHLKARHESGAIIIDVVDDGRGIDRERVRARAVERGLIAADAQLSDREVFGLLFEPGFSTAEQVTNLSGRGVGMDVVRRNIEALRGTIDLDSTPGQGTHVRIRLPLTLAIIDGFLSAVGDDYYVVPLETVDECVEFTEQYRAEAADHDYIDLRGQVLPLVYLRDHFRVKSELPRRQNILVVEHGGHKTGLVVDALLGEHQTVIKPLGEIFSGTRGLAGSTILGSGRVAMILDVPALVDLVQRFEGRPRAVND